MRKERSLGKALVIALLSVITQNIVYAQNAESIFSGSVKEIIWLGVDFTQVKIMGDIGTVSSMEIVPLFDKINLLIISEREKYNFKEALRKSEVPFDLEIVNEKNAGIDAEKTINTASSLDKKRINEALIADLVKKYKFEQQEGVGLVFFMETLDKISETGTMWVTFFNLSNHKVLLTERMTGVAGGVGFRNHWARTVYEVVNQIKLSKYQDWKSRYAQ